MPETTDPYLGELAQHIVTLADFWRHNSANLKPGADIRILRTLVETGLDVDCEDADAIAQLIVQALAALEKEAGSADAAGLANGRIEAVSALLREYAVVDNEQPTLFEVSLYR